MRTGSVTVAIAPAALMLLNANVLYLQSTPMTEPLLIGLALLAYAAVDEWVDAPNRAARTRAAWLLAALVMTRYEGWFIAARPAAVATIATRHRGVREWMALLAPRRDRHRRVSCVLGYASTGEWFCSASFLCRRIPRCINRSRQAVR